MKRFAILSSILGAVGMFSAPALAEGEIIYYPLQGVMPVTADDMVALQKWSPQRDVRLARKLSDLNILKGMEVAAASARYDAEVDLAAAKVKLAAAPSDKESGEAVGVAAARRNAAIYAGAEAHALYRSVSTSPSVVVKPIP